MIDLFYWPTPNGQKILMFLEEADVPHKIIPVNIGQGEQFDPAFLKISPNNKMPAIIDHDPVDHKGPLSLFESGAILLYLAEKTGKFMPQNIRGRCETLQWLFWQVSGLGPMAGQNHHFTQYASEQIPYAIARYVNETARLYAVLDKQLAHREFISETYSIADMACYPWIVPHEKQRQDLNDFPNVHRWFKTIEARIATQRTYAIGDEINPQTTMSEEAKKVLFGQDAKTVKRGK